MKKANTKKSVDLFNFPRKEKDGKVAVLYSPGYGAGWSTWNNDGWGKLLTTHRDIVEAVLGGSKTKAAAIAQELIRAATGNEDEHVCVLGADDLEVTWLPKGTKYEIQEYDGSESVRVISQDSFQTI